MRLHLSSLLLLVLLLFCVTSADCIADTVAYVQASSSDRVHLREKGDALSESKGLYFTGTPVYIPFNGGKSGWTYVVIGSEKGYVRSDLLASADEHIQQRWKSAKVNATGWVNLRSAPTKEASVLEKVPDGETIIVLGETSQKWYFVKYGSTFGYIMSRYLRISSQEVSEAMPMLAGLPYELPMDLYLGSGVGAWSIQMIIMPDGRFWGYYHDSDMGDAGAGYPNGTMYECSFTGTIADARKISEYEYQMQVQSMQCFGVAGQEKIEDETLIVTVDSIGLSQNEILSLYLPDVPENQLSEETLFWRMGYTYNEIPSILYGHNSGSVWCVE